MQYPMFTPMFPYWPYPQNFTAMNMEQNLNKEGWNKLATPVQPQTTVNIPEQKLNPQATPFVDKKEQGVATIDHSENDLEKISVDIFHAINEKSEKITKNAQVCIEKDSDGIYFENCKKIDITEQTIEKVTSLNLSVFRPYFLFSPANHFSFLPFLNLFVSRPYFLILSASHISFLPSLNLSVSRPYFLIPPANHFSFLPSLNLSVSRPYFLFSPANHFPFLPL